MDRPDRRRYPIRSRWLVKKDVDMSINGLSAGPFSRRQFARAAAALAAGICAAPLAPTVAPAQTAPSEAERAAYTGLHRAAALGDAAQIRKLLAQGADPKARDAKLEEFILTDVCPYTLGIEVQHTDEHKHLTFGR